MTEWINEALLWVLDLVQSVDPVARTLLAGLGIFLETSILIGLVVPGDTIVLVAATAVQNPVQYVGLLIAVGERRLRARTLLRPPHP